MDLQVKVAAIEADVNGSADDAGIAEMEWRRYSRRGFVNRMDLQVKAAAMEADVSGRDDARIAELKQVDIQPARRWMDNQVKATAMEVL